MLKNGLAVETGTHEMLMKRNGEYAKVYRSQMELEQYGKGAAV